MTRLGRSRGTCTIFVHRGVCERAPREASNFQLALRTFSLVPWLAMRLLSPRPETIVLERLNMVVAWIFATPRFASARSRLPARPPSSPPLVLSLPPSGLFPRRLRLHDPF